MNYEWKDVLIAIVLFAFIQTGLVYWISDGFVNLDHWAFKGPLAINGIILLIILANIVSVIRTRRKE